MERPIDHFDEALRAIAQNRGLQSRFLNTLSLLEFIGARKIIKSQPAEAVGLQLLTHASEELRHARTLKIAAERLAGVGYGYATDETLCGAQARAYFQGLDEAVSERVGHAGPRASYLYMTLLIEERALWAYPKVVTAFQDELVSRTARSLLVEEERHLKEIRSELEAIAGPVSVDELRSIEASRFAEFAAALREEVCGSVRGERAGIGRAGSEEGLRS
jgi:hypothetical protein